tara:strand:- start:528 stop:971 length:444 start_codon:yes stop_codon:yes gene_type:complete
MQRRKFIKDICRASIVCAAPSSLITLQSCSENDKQINGDLSEITINLNDPTYNKLNTVGQSMVTGSTDFDISGLLLLRKSQSDLLVYSRQCPHAGTSINAFLNGAATCPNHGAKFKTDGSPVPGGPTNAPLKQYTVDFNYPTATVFR